MVWKLEGYLLIPHELLHVIAHRVIGKRCSYRLGESHVTQIDPCTSDEHLFCLLFPLLVSAPISFVPLVVWFMTYAMNRYPASEYIYVAPLWHQALFVVWFLLFNYVASSCFYDVIFAIRLLLKKLRHQPPDDAGNH